MAFVCYPCACAGAVGCSGRSKCLPEVNCPPCSLSPACPWPLPLSVATVVNSVADFFSERENYLLFSIARNNVNKSKWLTAKYSTNMADPVLSQTLRESSRPCVSVPERAKNTWTRSVVSNGREWYPWKHGRIGVFETLFFSKRDWRSAMLILVRSFHTTCCRSR
jgi:hypothetical protein